jgi:hypothetical protein
LENVSRINCVRCQPKSLENTNKIIIIIIIKWFGEHAIGWLGAFLPLLKGEPKKKKKSQETKLPKGEPNKKAERQNCLWVLTYLGKWML